MVEHENARQKLQIEEHENTIVLLKASKRNALESSGGVDPSLRIVELQEEVKRMKEAVNECRAAGGTGGPDVPVPHYACERRIADLLEVGKSRRLRPAPLHCPRPCVCVCLWLGLAGPVAGEVSSRPLRRPPNPPPPSFLWARLLLPGRGGGGYAEPVAGPAHGHPLGAQGWGGRRWAGAWVSGLRSRGWRRARVGHGRRPRGHGAALRRSTTTTAPHQSRHRRRRRCHHHYHTTLHKSTHARVYS